MIFVPFFGEMGEYSGVAGVYSTSGVAAVRMAVECPSIGPRADEQLPKQS